MAAVLLLGSLFVAAIFVLQSRAEHVQLKTEVAGALTQAHVQATRAAAFRPKGEAKAAVLPRKLVREQRRAFKRFQRRLASPALRRERAESRKAFQDLQPAEALDVARKKQPQLIERPTTTRVQVRRGERLVDFRSPNAAQIRMDDGKLALAESSGLPLAAPADGPGGRGPLVPVELALKEQADHWVPERPAIETTLPKAGGRAATVGQVALTLPNRKGAGSLVGGAKAFYANQLNDTDIVLEPRNAGLEVSWVLRSPAAPVELPVDLKGAAGDALRFVLSGDGSVTALSGSHAVSRLSPLVAWDAQGREVIGKYVIADDGRLTVSIDHASQDLAYPIVIDPLVGGNGFPQPYMRDDAGSSPISGWGYASRNGWGFWESADVFSESWYYEPWLGIAMSAGNAGGYARWTFDPTRESAAFRVDYVNFSRNIGNFYTTLGLLYGGWGETNWHHAKWYNSTNGYADDPGAIVAQTTGGGPHQIGYNGSPPITVTVCASGPCNQGGNRNNTAVFEVSGNGQSRPQAVGGRIEGAVVYHRELDAPTMTSLTFSPNTQNGWIRDPYVVGHSSMSDSGIGFCSDGNNVSAGIASQPLTVTDDNTGNSYGYAWQGGCAGTVESPAPANTTLSWTEGQPSSPGVTAIPEGLRTLRFVARDMFGNTGPNSMTTRSVKIDRSGPEVRLSGRLGQLATKRTGAGLPSAYDIRTLTGQADLGVSVTDGATENVTASNTRSGVATVATNVYRLDNAGNRTTGPQAQPVSGTAPSTDNAQFYGSVQAGQGLLQSAVMAIPGLYELEVIATDRAGNTTNERYVFGVGGGTFETVIDGQGTARWVPIQVSRPGYNGTLSVQWSDANHQTFSTVPNGTLQLEKDNTNVSPSSLQMTNGLTDRYVLDLQALLAAATNPTQTEFPKDRLKIRVSFGSGSSWADLSEDVTIRLDRGGRSTDDAVTDLGVGSVDLLTGNLTIAETDLSVNSYLGGLSVQRTYHSRYGDQGGPLGPGWKLGVPADSQTDFQSITDLEDPSIPEADRYPAVLVTMADGQIFAFERRENDSSYAAEAGFEDYSLKRVASVTDPTQATRFEILDQTTGTTSVFQDRLPASTGSVSAANASGTGVVPPGVWGLTETKPAGSAKAPTYVYGATSAGTQLRRVIAPTDGVNCTTVVRGCQVLEFNYGAAGTGAQRLLNVTLTFWNSATNALNGPFPLVTYAYSNDSEARLVSVTDNRTGLIDAYEYFPAGNAAAGLLSKVTPPGERPYDLAYTTIAGQDAGAKGRLSTVSRDSLVAASPTATWTLQYDVPRSGSSAPWDMSSTSVDRWKQKVTPFKATGLVNPGQSTSTTAGDLKKIKLWYLDALGRTINEIEPGPADGSGNPTAAAISAIDLNKYGSVTRSLSPKNLTKALADTTDTKAAADRLSTQTVYSDNAYQRILDVKEPERAVRLPGSSTPVKVRPHRWSANSEFDEGVPAPSVAGQPEKGTTNDPSYPFNLVTTLRTGAYVTQTGLASTGTDQDVRVTKTDYHWKSRQAKKTIEDFGGLNRTRVVNYDDDGNEIERRQPSNWTDATANSAANTKTTYFRNNATDADCQGRPEWSGLVCKVEPVAQPTAAGLPKLPVKRYAYDIWRRIASITETVNGTLTRTTTRSYANWTDYVTRERVTSSIGAPINDTTHVYDSAGRETRTRTVDEANGDATIREIVRVYDDLGRVTSYTDGAGNTRTTTFDIGGRPATITDNKAAPNAVSSTRTFSYDPLTGSPTSIVDSDVGTTSTTYDLEGRPSVVTYPGGLTRGSTVDEGGNLLNVNYTRTTGCSSACVLFSNTVERDVRGQLIKDTGSWSERNYAYDGLGRLTGVEDTPSGGVCTARSYTYDINSNRETKRTVSGTSTVPACPTSGGSTVTQSYDGQADRLTGVNGFGLGNGTVTYDDLGRITAMPKQGNGGGVAQSFEYYANDQPKKLINGTVTITTVLDPLLRPYTRSQQTNGQSTIPVETYAYGSDSDSPTYTSKTVAPFWTRYVADPSGGLIQVNNTGSKLVQFTNARGDAVAEAALTATSVTTKFAVDEYGVPTGTTMGQRKYGFLGAAQRESLNYGSAVAMGARTYLPQVGRFAQTDPVMGGSAGPYDYVDGDPVNEVDLDGKCMRDSRMRCHSGTEGGAANRGRPSSPRRPKPVPANPRPPLAPRPYPPAPKPVYRKPAPPKPKPKPVQGVVGKDKYCFSDRRACRNPPSKIDINVSDKDFMCGLSIVVTVGGVAQGTGGAWWQKPLGVAVAAGGAYGAYRSCK